jgi:thiol-disulfide isomerase/thioredoxin
MKIFFIGSLLLALALSFSANAQTLVGKKLSYKTTETYKSKEDSIRNINYKLDSAIEEILGIAPKEEYMIDKDTVLMLDFVGKKLKLRNIEYHTEGKATRITVMSGREGKAKDYSYKKFKNLKSYKRIPKEDQEILGYNCKAYQCAHKNSLRTVWICETLEVSTDFPQVKMLINNQAILKQSTVFKSGSIRITEATEITDAETNNFGMLIAKHTASNIDHMYAPLLQNTQLPDKALKVGETMPNFYYRDVLSEEVKSIAKTNSKAEFTALEFWGTWCIPCLYATGKLKELRAQFGTNKLCMVSFNTRDKNIDKVKEVIEEKNMSWNQAYSTKKIVTLLNEKGQYPTIVLINKENKVLLIGHPVRDYDKIVELIN